MNREENLKNIGQRVIRVIDELASISQEYIRLEEWGKAQLIETPLIELKEGFIDEIMGEKAE